MTAGTLVLACALDAMIGDPRWLPHPVRLMGRAIAWYEQGARRVVADRTSDLVAGIVLAVGLPAVSYGVSWLAIDLSGRIHETVGKGVEVFLAFTTVAARDLADHASAVWRALESGSLEDARTAVARIVGRDTAQLSEGEVVRATVETVAESMSDGIVAPLFFAVLGGAPLALVYKAINTLDSMIGHREPPYRHFGWASARLDDVANWVPARATALLIAGAAGLVLWDTASSQRAWRLFLRDGKKHPSPNSGRPEAAMAGALGVRLGGTNYYDGVPAERPALGEPLRSLSPPCISEALRVMWTVFGLAALLASGLLLL
ncbi:MAG: cobalamin biosynthesis protein CobD [Nitrospirae bacterium 13_2_20CM_2_61_4]|nr:MAG: cobalamin biosynthesis protein CobD [Nitrospirae bacterium 13_2_20CM_2_61_4]